MPPAQFQRPRYSQVIGLQAAIAIVVAVAWLGLKGPSAGASALVGGLICVVPSALFAVRLWAAARRGGAFGTAFAVGELLKVGLTVALFFLVFRLYPGVDALALFVGFIATLQGYLFALLLHR